MGRYSEDPEQNKRDKAQRTWDHLSVSDRGAMSLADFTKQVNQRHSGSYEPWEFETILAKLREGIHSG